MCAHLKNALASRKPMIGYMCLVISVCTTSKEVGVHHHIQSYCLAVVGFNITWHNLCNCYFLVYKDHYKQLKKVPQYSIFLLDDPPNSYALSSALYSRNQVDCHLHTTCTLLFHRAHIFHCTPHSNSPFTSIGHVYMLDLINITRISLKWRVSSRTKIYECMVTAGYWTSSRITFR